MKIRNILLSILLAAGAVLPASAQFFSTDQPERIFTLGVRAGVNTSNITVGEKNLKGYNVSGWGTGLNIGVVADIALRDYISIQPGFFFQSRTNNFTYVTPLTDTANPVYLTQAGHWRGYQFSIPVLGSVKFNLSDNIRWSVDLGPYFNFFLNSKRTNRVSLASGGSVYSDYLFSRDPRTVDVGLKMGTGLQIADHYYVGVHYLAGLTGAWKDETFEQYKRTFGGCNKMWTFTIGYDF